VKRTSYLKPLPPGSDIYDHIYMPTPKFCFPYAEWYDRITSLYIPPYIYLFILLWNRAKCTTHRPTRYVLSVSIGTATVHRRRGHHSKYFL
jgi:hypothetical protein